MAVRYKITVNPDFENLRQFIETIPHRNEELGEVVYRARNVVFRNDETGTPLCIKSFKIPPIYNRIAYTFLRKSKARRSYENALRLLKVGILTPAPVAYIEVYRDSLLERSYYICLMIEAQHVRAWQERRDGEDIARNVADLLYRLHSAHIWHRDFSPGNVIYDKDGNYYIIDINRMQFNVRSKKKLAQNFIRINESPTETENLVRAYAKRVGISDVQPLIDWVLKAHNRFWNCLYKKCRRREEKRLKKKKI